MSLTTLEAILDLTASLPVTDVDITGGEPLLYPNLSHLIETLFFQRKRIQVRTNLTLFAGEQADYFVSLFATYGVTIVGSLPCYREDNVEFQRGKGIYERLVRALKFLNERGYGVSEKLPLHLVYNPTDAFLPAPQAELREAFRRELRKRHGISFHELLVLTNMPLGRFRRFLTKTGKLNQYDDLLQKNFNPATLSLLMCRYQISVDYDGTLYDCDFNLALKMAVGKVEQFDSGKLQKREIRLGGHCLGCMAGAGSSCGGELIPALK